MSKFPKTLWAALAALILLVLGALGIIVGQNSAGITNTDNQQIQQKTESQKLNIKVVDQNKTEKEYAYDFNLQNTDSLLSIFTTLDSTSNDFSIEYKDFSFGKMINAVNGYTAKANEFWNIKVNGSDAQVGVSDLKVNPGDTVELIITAIQ